MKTSTITIVAALAGVTVVGVMIYRRRRRSGAAAAADGAAGAGAVAGSPAAAARSGGGAIQLRGTNPTNAGAAGKVRPEDKIVSNVNRGLDAYAKITGAAAAAAAAVGRPTGA